MSQFLFVCSGGGHLKQLFTLSTRFGIDPADQHWVTFDNGLSRSLLGDRRVTFSRRRNSSPKAARTASVSSMEPTEAKAPVAARSQTLSQAWPMA